MEKKVKFIAYTYIMQEKTIISGTELLERLEQEKWSTIIPKLQYYSLNKLKRHEYLADRFNINNLAVNFADEAIKQIWLEERRWNIDYYKDVFSLLKGVVDSLIYNFLSSKEMETTGYISEELEDEITGEELDPEALLRLAELEIEVEELFKEDKQEQAVFLCLKDNLKPREICTELQIDINEIYNILKRVERKLTTLRNKLKL